MRAEPLVDALVPALGGEVEVELPQRRREGIRVVQDQGRALRVADFEPVLERQFGPFELALEQPGGMRADELDGLEALGPDADALGLGAERADDDAPVLRVRAEQAVRVGEPPLDELVDGTHSVVSSSRAIPATGMRTQSGRLSSS